MDEDSKGADEFNFGDGGFSFDGFDNPNNGEEDGFQTPDNFELPDSNGGEIEDTTGGCGSIVPPELAD